MMSDYEREARELLRNRPGFARVVARIVEAEAVSKHTVATGLTARQRDLLEFIGRHIDHHGIAPTYDQMRDELDLASKSGIARMVKGLEKRGYIARLPHHARAITILGGAA